jgi:hypothetical protein
MERNLMQEIVARIPVVVAGFVLMLAALFLSTSRLEYCGQTAAPAPRCNAVAAKAAPSPTLAPPQKVVLVQVVTDKTDLEIHWAEN